MPESLLPQSELAQQYPEHWSVLEHYAPEISRLSQKENERYQRSTKPLGMHIQFLVNTDVTTATYQGGELDIRTRMGLVTKPSEILEAAQALVPYYAMMVEFSGHESELTISTQQALQDVAAEAVVEVSDVIYNAFQIYLNNQEYGAAILQPCLVNLEAGDLELLLEVAQVKYQIRYDENSEKNIQAENKKIREILIQKNIGPIFDVLHRNRARLTALLLQVRTVAVDLAEKLEVRYDSTGNDKALQAIHLEAFLNRFGR